LDKCTGCKACVSACHSLNGLDEDETWRDVGTISGGLAEASYSQTVTTACHHCADPACLNGCPVLAYEKDPVTGIVHHLDDQCIGCQYCALKCPYDVPKYSKKLGIVRKCDMCHSRLAEGEAPACVQACPTEAISITIVNTQATVTAARSGGAFLPTAPDPGYTVPTTQYVTQREIPADVEAGDLHALKPEPAHLPLALMLVLTQLSVGLFGLSLLRGEAAGGVPVRVAAFIAMAIGLAASTSHLGRPLGAWRAFLGLRRSWLSREIVIFGGCSVLALGYTAAGLFDVVPAGMERLLGWATLISGLLGVFSSVMIYVDTHRPFWSLPLTTGKFFGTLLLLTVLGSICTDASFGAASSLQLGAVMLLLLAKLALEAQQLRAAGAAEMSPAKKSACLMLYPLRTILLARYACAFAGLLALGFLWIAPASPHYAELAALLLLAGELLERVLFFQAVAAPKMPGDRIA
jgi:formate dehydrogenase iron-sulfur subunit